MNLDEAEKKIKELEEALSTQEQKRVGQMNILSAAIKQTHLVTGEMAAGDLYYGDGANNFVRVPAGEADQLLTMSGGVPTWATAATPVAPTPGQTSSAFAYQSVAQTLATGTAAAVNLESESWDTDAIHSTSVNITRFTIPTAGTGKWLFIGQARFTSNSTGDRGLYFFLNGTTIIARIYISPAGSFSTFTQISLIANLAATDYIQLFAEQDSGGNLDLVTGAGATFLECHRMS